MIQSPPHQPQDWNRYTVRFAAGLAVELAATKVTVAWVVVAAISAIVAKAAIARKPPAAAAKEIVAGPEHTSASMAWMHPDERKIAPADPAVAALMASQIAANTTRTETAPAHTALADTTADRMNRVAPVLGRRTASVHRAASVHRGQPAASYLDCPYSSSMRRDSHHRPASHQSPLSFHTCQPIVGGINAHEYTSVAPITHCHSLLCTPLMHADAPLPRRDINRTRPTRRLSIWALLRFKEIKSPSSR